MTKKARVISIFNYIVSNPNIGIYSTHTLLNVYIYIYIYIGFGYSVQSVLTCKIQYSVLKSRTISLDFNHKMESKKEKILYFSREISFWKFSKLKNIDIKYLIIYGMVLPTPLTMTDERQNFIHLGHNIRDFGKILTSLFILIFDYSLANSRG